jgi:hypothetical protein
VGLLLSRQCHEEGRREYMQDVGGVISSTGSNWKRVSDRGKTMFRK